MNSSAVVRKGKTMTNREKLRQMSDEELGAFLCRRIFGRRSVKCFGSNSYSTDCIVAWMTLPEVYKMGEEE